MSDVVIHTEGLSKRYRIGQRQQYLTLREVLTDILYAPFRRFASMVRQPSANGGHKRPTTHEWIWALEDVSFGIKHGEIVGIIGRNGAGKTTLLKILSRITSPTRGRARIYGRVGSLLEVGTGFHPELTGRENIYLSGAILGMKKAEINRKFEEIVTFAEVEKFLDTPVKRYSSGMFVRLAFAVAAHIEPQILMIDEVLAVGDAVFQKKCLGKMSDVAKEGRTVLFVSHNMIAVEDLCSRAIWLHNGKIVEEGPSREVTSRYLQMFASTLTERVWHDITTAPGNEQIRISWVRVRPANGSSSDPITVRTPFVIEIGYWNLKHSAYLNINCRLYNEQGILIFDAGPVNEPIWRPLPRGLFCDICHVPGNLLNDGMYRISLCAVSNGGTLVHQEDVILVFDIQDTPDLRDGWYGKWGGAIRPLLEWDRQIIKADKTPLTDGMA